MDSLQEGSWPMLDCHRWHSCGVGCFHWCPGYQHWLLLSATHTHTAHEGHEIEEGEGGMERGREGQRDGEEEGREKGREGVSE